MSLSSRLQALDAERWLVVLIAAHSLVVGLALMIAPQWAPEFGGWSRVEPLFFIRQAGIFHFVLATGYLLEHFRRRDVMLLLTAKALAVVFLLGYAVAAPVPWIVPFSGVADGLMGAAVVAVRRLVQRPAAT